MTLVMRTAVAALFVAGLLLATAVAAANCAGHEESGALAEARDGTKQIMTLIGDNEIDLARERFLETHRPLHLTANELEPVDPEIAEVVNDFTEALDDGLLSEPLDRQRLIDLTERTLAWLDEAHFALDG